MKTTFTTTVTQAEGMNATGLPVPAEAVAALGSGKRPKVKVDINGYVYRSTVAAYGDVFMLPMAAEHRQAAGVKAGDEVNIALELDTEPRTVEVPPDLAQALSKVGAMAAFDALSYTMRKEYLVKLVGEKETRQRRLQKSWKLSRLMTGSIQQFLRPPKPGSPPPTAGTPAHPAPRSTRSCPCRSRAPVGLQVWGVRGGREWVEL
jgi:hypothetical protein